MATFPAGELKDQVAATFRIHFTTRNGARVPAAISVKKHHSPLPQTLGEIDSGFACKASPYLVDGLSVLEASTKKSNPQIIRETKPILDGTHAALEAHVRFQWDLDSKFSFAQHTQFLQLKTDEVHIRAALEHALSSAFAEEGKMDLKPIAALYLDLQNFQLAMGTPFCDIRLTSDIRVSLLNLFAFLIGLRSTYASSYAWWRGELIPYSLGMSALDFTPEMNLHHLADGAYFYHISLANLGNQENELRNRIAQFYGEPDGEPANLPELDDIFQACIPYSHRLIVAFYEFAVRIGLTDLENCAPGEEDVIFRAAAIYWASSDAGLIYALNRELQALNEGYRTFWPLLGEESDTMDKLIAVFEFNTDEPEGEVVV